MKSFTDIEQSKKLAEILPLESADMYWEYNHNIHTYDDIPRMLVVNNWDDYYNKDIPAWSLNALLELMPIETHLYKMQDEDNYTKHYYKVGSFDGKGWIELNNTLAIDAVYEMVCWLKENNEI